MEDNVSKIKDKLDIVDVISGYLKLAKSGINYKARCPFHNEKTPSFFVSPERQTWHCFGCLAGGDMFTFIQQIEGVEFREALRTLAQRAGVTLEYSSDLAAKDDKAVLYEICETASRFFEKQLNNSNAGKRALEYLKNRGLTDETIKESRLGFAPSEWESLSTFLRNCDYKDKDIVDAGLAIKRTTNDQETITNKGIYDRFRSRIIFPISDLNGQIVGFTGRVFEGDEKEAKYINTPQTAIYDKGRILYGLNKAKTEIRREDKCVMVEGNLDALMSHQAGVKNVVATSGTALTQAHLKLLERFTKRISLCLDTDQAGQLAARRGLGMTISDAISSRFDVSLVVVDDPECKDPADYVRKHGDGWKVAVDSSKPAIQYYFDMALAKLDPKSTDYKKSVIESVGPFIKRLPWKTEYFQWVSNIASILRVPNEAVIHDLEQEAKDDMDTYENQKSEIQSSQIKKDLSEDPLSETLLSVVLKNPDLFKEELNIIPAGLLDNYTDNIIVKIRDSGNVAETMKEIREKEQSYKLEFAYLRSQELWKDFKNEELKMEFQNLMSKIKKRAVSAQINNLVYDMKEAEAKKDKERVRELSLKFVELINQFPHNG